ncbi:hypothetical protein LZ30DRAFT_552059, partial [Colletotrichum cereale]
TLIKVCLVALCLMLISGARLLRLGKVPVHKTASPADANRVADEHAFCPIIADAVVVHQ